MRKQITLLMTIILTLFAVKTFSQTKDTLQPKKIIITTSLLGYLPSIYLNTGNFNLGTEIYLKNRNSVYANIGILKSYGESKGWLCIPSSSTQGMKIQVEFRHYLKIHKIFEPAILLFWPHIFQYKSQQIVNAGYYVSCHSFYQNTETEKFSYTVDRTAAGLNIKIGYQCIKKCGLTIDYSVGLGGQYISSSSRNKDGVLVNVTNSDKDMPWNKKFDNGSGIYPSISYQLKLGWGF